MAATRRNGGAGLALLLALTLGCGEENRGAVSGEVTLDGQPIDGGEIRFIPESGPPAWAKIEGGHYQIPASTGPALGPARVEIRWTRKTGRQIPAVPPAPAGSMLDETVEAVPDRYHARSELTAEIKRGKNTLDFALTSP